MEGKPCSKFVSSHINGAQLDHPKQRVVDNKDSAPNSTYQLAPKDLPLETLLACRHVVTFPSQMPPGCMYMKSNDGGRRLYSFLLAAISVASCCHIVGQGTALAQAPPHTTPASVPAANGAGSLNLSSHTPNFSASQLGSFHSITINVGGKPLSVTGQSALTAAEFVAAANVLATGHQTMALFANGIASGGSFLVDKTLLNAQMGGAISSILVPKHVQLIDALQALSLNGSLINYGSIVGATSKMDVSISAVDTYNGVGGTISSGHDLSLAASNSLINLGVISAARNLNINAQTVINSGTLAAVTGNVNLTGQNQINVDNTGGTIQAGQNINFRDAAYAGANGINIIGGTLNSQMLNLFSGNGEVDVTGSNITGVVNTYAGVDHMIVDTPNLKVGVTQVSNDPLIANSGNVIINVAQIDLSVVPNLSVVAGKNILSSGGALDTPGGQLNLIAGVNFVNQGSNAVVITGPSATGGLIDLTGKNGGSAPITGINTAGGNILLVATAGSAAGSGTVALPASAVIDASSTSGQGGAINIFAGANKGTTISLGSILDNSIAGSTAFVRIVSAQPNFGQYVVDGTTGVVSAPTVGNPLAGNIAAGTVTASTGDVTITTNGGVATGTINVSGLGGTTANPNGSNGGFIIIISPKISTGSLLAYGGGGAGGGVGINGGSGGTGGQISLAPIQLNLASSITVNGSINVSGGGGGGGGGSDSNAGANGTGGSGGSAANVSVSANGPVVVTQGILAADGGSGGDGTTAPLNTAGNGGGGGGSLGGAGGGGSSGAKILAGDTPGAAGGGGGGLFGGGGGGVQTVQGSIVPLTGGNGGGINGAGGAGSGDVAGGNGDAAGNGGSGAGNGVIGGGTGGAPFQGGAGGPGAGSGQFAVSGGQVQNGAGGANIALTSPTNTAMFGTSKAPLTLTTYAASVTGNTGFLNLPVGSTINGNLSTLNLSVGSGANVQVSNTSVLPNITISGITIAQNGQLGLNLQGPGSTVTGAINGGANAILSILQQNAPAPSGGNLTVNGAVNMQAPTSAAGPNLILSASTGELRLNGKINSGGQIVLTGGQLLAINGPIASTAQTMPAISLSTNGPILQAAGGTLTAPSVEVSSLAPSNTVTVNTPNLLFVNASLGTVPSISFKDTSTANTTVDFEGRANVFNVTSAASNLTFINGTFLPFPSQFDSGTISETNASGNVSFNPTNGLVIEQSLTVNTVGGNINSSGITLNGNIVLTSKTGNIGTPANPGVSAAAPFKLTSSGGSVPNLTAMTGGNGQALITASSSLTVNGITAPGGISVSLPGFHSLNIVGNVTAKNSTALVSLNAFGIASGSSNPVVLSGGNLAVSGAFIGSSGLPLNISATGSTLITAGSAALNAVNGNFNLAPNSTVGGTLNVLNTAGSLTLSGTLASAPAGAVNVSAKNNVSEINGNILSSGTDTETITAGGALSLPAGTTMLQVGRDGLGNGGTLNIQVGSLAFPTAFTINADATPGVSAKGGSVSLAITGKQNVTLGTGQLVISAKGGWDGSTTGGAGGLIAVSNGGNIIAHQSGIINAPAAGGGGNGSQTILSAGSNLTLPDAGTSLTTAGDLGASGGLLSLSAGSNLSVAGNLVAANSNGTLIAAANGKNFQIGAGSTPANGIAGTLSAGGGSPVIQVSNPNGITLNNTIQAHSLEFDTGSFTNASSGAINLGPATFPFLTFNSGKGDLVLSGAGNWGAAAQPQLALTLTSGGAMSTGPLFTAAAIQTARVISITAGGALNLGTNLIDANAASFGASQLTVSASSFKAPGTGALALQAASFAGGSVAFTMTSTKSLTLGTGAGQVSITTGGVGGKSVLVSNGGPLTVGAGGISTTSGTINNLALLSGGALSYPNYGSAPVSATANLLFSTNSGTPFTVSPTSGNGLQMAGTLSATTLSITNNGGSIGTTSPLTVNAPQLSLVAGKTGSVNVADTAASVTLNNAAGGTTFTLNVSNTLVPGTGIIATKNLAIQAGAISGPLTTNATTVSLTATTGNQIIAVDTATAAVNLNTVSMAGGSASTFGFQTAGPLNINSAIPAGSVDVSANGTIAISQPVGLAGGTTKVVAPGNGAITTSATGSINGANLTLQSGSGGMGSKQGALTINGTNLTVASSGPVTLSDTSVSATTLNTTTSVFGSFTLTSAGALTIDSITSAGPISISAPGITLGNIANPAPAVLNSAKGDITLNAGTQSLALAQAQVLSANGNINLLGNTVSTDQQTTVTANGGNTNITANTSNAAGTINLAGLVSSTTGNLTIGTSGTNGAAVTNNQGTIQAGGNLSIATAGGQFTTASTNILANGNININSGSGTMTINSAVSSLIKGNVILNGANFVSNGAAQISTNAGNLQVTTAVGGGGSTVKGSLTAVGGDVIFTSSGTGLTTFGGGTVQGNNVTIQETGTGSLLFSGSNTVSNNGAVTVNAAANTITFANASIAANGGSGAKSGVTISGATITNSGGGAFNSITANNGNLTVNGTTTGSGLDAAFLSTTGGVNLKFTGSANLNAQGGNASIQGTSVNITSGGSSLNIAAGTINATLGSVTITNTNSSSGSIDLGSGTLSVGASSGNVVVQNFNTAGNVTLESGMTVQSTGTAAKSGNVTIVLGAKLPTAAQLAAQTVPPSPNVSYAITAPGHVFFASGGVTPVFNGAGGASSINALGKDVTLFVPAGSTGNIVLQGADTLTASPVSATDTESSDFVVDTAEDASEELLSER